MLRGASFHPLILYHDRTKPERMTRSMHIFGYFLVTLIALTAQSAAIARTMPDAAGQMVLCTGNGPVMVYFDEHGEPTAPPHLCPDFALSLILGLDVEDVTRAAMGAWSLGESLPFVKRRVVFEIGTPNARGPPVLMLV